jgi:hypothetical protein
MKTKIVISCAAILLAAPALLAAQKTEVSVRKGKVVAETPTTSVAVEAGRKAVLSPGKNPAVRVDEPLVDDVMEIYKWIEAEKQASRQPFDSTWAVVIRIDDENRCTGALLSEVPNKKSQPSRDYWMDDSSILADPRFYDLTGHLLQFDFEQRNAMRGDYTIHFPQAVGPGELFRYVTVGRLNGIVWRREAPLWILPVGSGRVNCLAYYRVVLPKSAIFVDSSHPVVMTDAFEGRVAVTVRNLTGPASQNSVNVAFLWPDRDGTTLADLPPQYRGLRDPSQEQVVREGRRRTAEILAGGTYMGQKTPLETLLSLYSAAVNKDTAQLLELVAPDVRQIVAGKIDQMMGTAGVMFNFQFLGTPAWPDEPKDGYEHPVYLCREGSLLCELTIIMASQGGKWYVKNVESGHKQTLSADNAASQVSGGVTITKGKPDLSAATYQGLKPGQFMRRWLFLGPVHVPWKGPSYFPDEEASNKFFDAESLAPARFEPKVRIGETDYEWTALYSEYGVIDLTAVFDTWFVVGYAWAQVEMPEETTAVLGIGSDDCIKVWLNGQLVHEKRGGRGVVPDNDRVPVTFKKGKNQLVLKILNYGGPWGFACRLLKTE